MSDGTHWRVEIPKDFRHADYQDIEEGIWYSSEEPEIFRKIGWLVEKGHPEQVKKMKKNKLSMAHEAFINECYGIWKSWETVYQKIGWIEKAGTPVDKAVQKDPPLIAHQHFVRLNHEDMEKYDLENYIRMSNNLQPAAEKAGLFANPISGEEKLKRSERLLEKLITSSSSQKSKDSISAPPHSLKWFEVSIPKFYRHEEHPDKLYGILISSDAEIVGNWKAVLIEEMSKSDMEEWEGTLLASSVGLFKNKNTYMNTELIMALAKQKGLD